MKICFKVEDIDTKEVMEKTKAFNLVNFDHRLKFDGFMVDEDGLVVVADNCGNFAYLPTDSYELKVLMGD